jgi:hypothetical protein
MKERVFWMGRKMEQEEEERCTRQVEFWVGGQAVGEHLSREKLSRPTETAQRRKRWKSGKIRCWLGHGENE